MTDRDETRQLVLGLMSARHNDDIEASAELLRSMIFEGLESRQDMATMWRELATTAIDVAYEFAATLAIVHDETVEDMLTDMRRSMMQVSGG